MVLYEVYFQFDFIMIVPVLMLVSIILFPRIMDKAMERTKEVKYNKKFVRIFCTFALIFVVLIGGLGYWGLFDMYQEVVGAYKDGDYEIVEGYVENFEPMPYEGHAQESFDINGVHFEYSDYTLGVGYNNAKSHGGVIHGDGQHLKIGYVYHGPEHGNIIVYIEEIL